MWEQADGDADARVRDRDRDRPPRATPSHTDRGELRAPLIVDALGWRRVLSNAHADPAPATRVSRAASRSTRRAPAATWSCGSTPATCARATRGASPPATSCASASAPSGPRHHVKEPTVRLAGDLGLPARGLPGQLDPPPAAARRRGRRLLRRRLGRALPAADRRGHPHRALLRARLRARAARGARRAAHARAGAARATAPSPTPTRASSAGCSRSSARSARSRRAAPLTALVRALREPPADPLGVRPLPRDRAAVVRRAPAPPRQVLERQREQPDCPPRSRARPGWRSRGRARRRAGAASCSA